MEESLSAWVLAKLLERVRCCLLVFDLSTVEFKLQGRIFGCCIRGSSGSLDFI